MLATNDENNTYLQGLAVGKELRNYGINANFAPVLDVNNNPANPVIGARSYGENPFLVARYGVGLINGLRDSKVMATSKHFPGHGNTSVDSHSGLPVITSSKEDLYKIELAFLFELFYMQTHRPILLCKALTQAHNPRLPCFSIPQNAVKYPPNRKR